MNKTATVIAALIVSLGLVCLASCKKNYLSKDERSTLFATPEAEELDDIFHDWQSRSLVPTGYEILQQADLFSGSHVLKIVSFRANGIKQYGALIIPDSGGPVQMLVGGFGLGTTTNSVNLVLDSSGSGQARILAIPALRGQSLSITINGTTYNTPTSEGEHCDAFDGAADDVLAFLNLIQQTESNADVGRTGVRGGSRGGTVALLAGVRDTRIKRVVGVVAPMNMLELTSEHENDATYQCQFLSRYKNGGISLAEARRKMLASSPIYFAQHLPIVQLHMGLNDTNVPIKQGYDMEKRVGELGNAARFRLFTYDRSHQDIAANNAELSERIEEFLSQL